MAEEIKEREQGKGGHRYGGGNRNAIAYGLLQGAGYNTAGMSPAQAWALVTQLNLMESQRWKRTDEDKERIKRENDALKAGGASRDDVVSMAKHSAGDLWVDASLSNVAALRDAIQTINDLYDEYGIKRLNDIYVKRLSNGAMASANARKVNIGDRIIRNPSAAYRICVENFEENERKTIELMEAELATASEKRKVAIQQTIDAAKESLKYKRHNVVYKGQEVQSVMVHEMGHVIAGQLAGFVSMSPNNPTNTKLRTLFEESKANGDIYKVSQYAVKNADEFFAECFTMYTMGKERLPERIHNTMEEILKQWKRRK